MLFRSRFHDCLYLLPLEPALPIHKAFWTVFPGPLVLSSKRVLSARAALEGVRVLLSDEIVVRFRRGGESFVWHGQTKSLKKLMQAWDIPPWLRGEIPLILYQ